METPPLSRVPDRLRLPRQAFQFSFFISRKFARFAIPALLAVLIGQSLNVSMSYVLKELVDALVRHLDETGPARAMAERDAVDLATHLGERLALNGVPLADGVAMFVSARRPFLAEMSMVTRRRGVDAVRIGDLYDVSTGLLDRLLLAFVAGHEAAAGELSVVQPEPDAPPAAL